MSKIRKISIPSENQLAMLLVQKNAVNVGNIDQRKVTTLINYRAIFEAPDFDYGRMVNDQPGVFPYPFFSIVALDFLRACMESGLLLTAPLKDQPTKIAEIWDDRTLQLKRDLSLWERASLDDLRVYLTVAFAIGITMPAGLLLEFRHGGFLRVLKRLKTLNKNE